MRLLLAAILALFAGPALAQLHPTGRAVATQAVEQVIRPGFERFADAADHMQSAATALCAAPSGESLEAVRQGFKDVVDAWSRVELYRIGPLLDENRSERILFWPDRKGIALRQVQQALAKADESAADPASLRNKSVAMQGLGALEYLLFGTDADQLLTHEGVYRCKYGKAIATLLADVATELQAEWEDPEGISKRLIIPAEGDPDYRSRDEVNEALIGILAHGVEAIRDQRILPFLGREGEEVKPRSALFWRSGMTVPSIEGNFEGLRALLAGSDIWEYAPTEQFGIGQDAFVEFDKVKDAAAKASASVEEALADPAQKQALNDIVTSSQVLGRLTGEDLPAALGLSVGFSSLDGD